MIKDTEMNAKTAAIPNAFSGYSLANASSYMTRILLSNATHQYFEMG